MSTLSGIISAGAAPGAPGGLGGIIDTVNIYGQVANIGAVQYLRTGWLQPYESRHAPLISAYRPWGTVTGICFNKNFSHDAYTAALVSNSNTVHVITIPNGGGTGVASGTGANVRICANATGFTLNTSPAANTTNTTLTSIAVSGWGLVDATTFKGNVVIAGYLYDGGTTYHTVTAWTSNTGSYTQTLAPDPISQSVANKYTACIAANAANVIIANYSLTNQSTAYTGDLYSSTDAVTWSRLATGITGRYVARFFWHPLLSVWYIITTVGEIYTSPDAATWTSRTPPGGMPTSIPQFPMAWGMFANTANAGFVSVSTNAALGYNRILKINSLTSYSLLSFETETYPQGGFAGGNHALYYDGTRLIKFKVGVAVGSGIQTYSTSTDDGVTWNNNNFSLALLVANNSSNTVTAGNTGFNNPTVCTNLGPLTRSGPGNNVFISGAGVFMQGISAGNPTADAGKYYLADITANVTQSTPDYVGMTYASPTGYIRTI